MKPNSPPEQFDNVTVVTKANVYFDGKVVSHTVRFGDGSRKTLGLIFAGTYRFDVGVGERMEITSGVCRAKREGESDFRSYATGDAFEVPPKSYFEIAVDDGVAQYVCSFL